MMQSSDPCSCRRFRTFTLVTADVNDRLQFLFAQAMGKTDTEWGKPK
jgi:hypothetical protein